MTRLLIVLSLFSLSASLPAQNVIVHDIGAGFFAEGVGSSPLYPAAGVPLGAFPQLFPLPPVFPGPGGLGVPPGAMTIDNAAGAVWYSNGPFIAVQPHPAYPGAVAPIPPFPAPPFPPAPFPAVAIGISGMAIDPIGGILWMTNGFTVQGCAPIPGTPVIVPPFVPALPIAAFGPMTGLEWDPITGTLWAVDVAGTVINFLPGGALVAAPIAGVIPLPGPVTGIAIDKTGLPAAAPVIIPFPVGRSLYIVSAGVIADLTTGLLFPSFAGNEVGMAFHAAPQPSPPGGPCVCPSFGPSGFNLKAPCAAGNAGFGIDWVGLPPFNPCFILADIVFNPGFPTVNIVGCPLGMVPTSPTLVAIPAAADGTGTLVVNIPLTFFPPGVLFYLQYVTACSADPFGFALSPLFQVAVAAP